jgi:hypothetical protein
MPVIHVDSEQAALISAALEMFEAALSARVVRVDPEQIISKALALQAMKLATVRKLLLAPDPPAFHALSPLMLKKAHDLLWVLHTDQNDTQVDQWWEALRQVMNAPGDPA